ncbi:MAG: HI0074 family nucleotidyltransferase substrate-binding subunit [Candidatus Melainabacteria bacterium]|nr:HI0074 family nucleotidyltransferase substrate-binding subunit [Candidatus Melainabacteria bacterium]
MSKLKEKYENTSKALTALKKMLKRDHKDEAVRDSIIKRFEFTVEMSWKLYKVFFEVTSHKINSPKDIFREMLEYQILNTEEVEQALDMIDARNTSSHEYNEDKAASLAEEIPQYIPLLEKMLNYKGLQESL